MKLAKSKGSALSKEKTNKKVITLVDHRSKKLTPEPPKAKVNINKMVDEYAGINAQLKILNDRKALLAAEIKGYAVKNGTKDTNGSYTCENDSFVFGQSATKNKSLKKDAAEKLSVWGFGDCITTKSVVELNAEMVEKYFIEGALTEDNILDLYDFTDGSPKIFVTKKEEIPEIQPTRLASKKKRSLR